MVRVIEESQKNSKIMRRHGAHRRFWLLHKGNTEVKETPRRHTSNHYNWSPSYKSIK